MSAIAKRVADIADQEGMWARDLPRFPSLLEPHGLDPEDVTPEVASRADAINREEFQLLLERYSANRINTLQEPPTPPPSPPKVKIRVFGKYQLLPVLRWFGGMGYDWDEAQRALRDLGVDVPKNTAQRGIWEGVRGQGNVAEMTEEEQRILEFAAE